MQILQYSIEAIKWQAVLKCHNHENYGREIDHITLFQEQMITLIMTLYKFLWQSDSINYLRYESWYLQKCGSYQKNTQTPIINFLEEIKLSKQRQNTLE